MTILLSIRDFHTAFALVVIFSNLAAAILAFVAHRVRAYGGRPFWAFIVLAQTMVFVQAILGVALQSDENLPPRDFHYLYYLYRFSTMLSTYKLNEILKN